MNGGASEVLGVETKALSSLTDEITDEELKAETPVELLVGACDRRLIQGSGVDKPLEVFSGLYLVRKGLWAPRTIRAKSHFASTIRTQAIDAGVGWLNLKTAELVARVPVNDEQGSWRTVDSKTGAPCLLLVRVKIDKTRGAAAGKGRRTTYSMASGKVELDTFKKKVPEVPVLASGEIPLLAVTSADEDQDDDEDEDPRAKRPRKEK